MPESVSNKTDAAEIENLYESDSFLIVNKPYDMYINSENPLEKNTLKHRLNREVYFPHRLDYATSGAICLAKEKRAAAAAGRCFEKRTANKYYIAVVRGHMSGERVDIRYDVGEDKTESDIPNMMRAVCCHDDAVTTARPRHACTRVLTLHTGRYKTDPASIVMIKLYTGRRHQIRVHCSSIEHPVLGDFTYSKRQDRHTHRMFLHALRLELPVKNEPIDVETQEPFLSDIQFSDLWTSERILNSFETKEDRRRIYSLLDSDQFPNVDYKCYQIKE